MSLFDTVLVSFLTTFCTASIAFFFYFLRVRMKEKALSKAELEQNKRASFKKLLDEHSEILLSLDPDKSTQEWIKGFSDMSKGILLWGSDNVLTEYGKYIEKDPSAEFKIEEKELNFAKAILAFRKELGYINKKNIITPEQIVLIFRCGSRKSHI